MLLVPAWSLDVEMQFYMLFPLLYCLLERFSLLIKLCFIGLLCIGWSFLSISWNLLPICFYIGFFILGMLLDRSSWQPSLRLLRLSFVGLGLALLFPYFCTDFKYLIDCQNREPPAVPSQQHISVVYDYVLALLAFPYIAHSVHVKSDQNDRLWGDFAYPLYLFHWIPLIAFSSINFLLQLPSPLFLLLNWGIMLGGAWLIFKYFDQPIDAIRRRLVEQWIDRNSERR
ncbi:MAG: acyltransferase family protein [Prosthecobacter sp.]